MCDLLVDTRHFDELFDGSLILTLFFLNFCDDYTF